MKKYMILLMISISLHIASMEDESKKEHMEKGLPDSRVKEIEWFKSKAKSNFRKSNYFEQVGGIYGVLGSVFTLGWLSGDLFKFIKCDCHHLTAKHTKIVAGIMMSPWIVLYGLENYYRKLGCWEEGYAEHIKEMYR